MERWCAQLKADSPEEKSSPCQRLVEPCTCSGLLLLSVSTETVQTHCVLIINMDFFFLFCSLVIFAAAHVHPCIVFMSRITYLIFVCCLLPHESLTTMYCQGQCFKHYKGKEDLLLTSPSPEIHSNSWRVFEPRGHQFLAYLLHFYLKNNQTPQIPEFKGL